jgi:hypothetical protein
MVTGEGDRRCHERDTAMSDEVKVVVILGVMMLLGAALTLVMVWI